MTLSIIAALAFAGFAGMCGIQDPPAPPPDVIKDFVLKFLASYGGLSILVVSLVSGAKAILKEGWLDGKEPALAVVLTIVLGIAAKLILPTAYGTNNLESWGLHGLILIFVAIGAKGIHDGIINAFRKPAAVSGTDPAKQ